MRLKPDKALRDRWFVPGAMSHPAKGHLGLWWEIFEKYTRPGEWVLVLEAQAKLEEAAAVLRLQEATERAGVADNQER